MKDGTEDSEWAEKMLDFGGFWQGRKVCRLKGVCCFGQPNPGKHRPAKPFGKNSLNTFPGKNRKNDAGFWKATRVLEELEEVL